MASLFSNHGHYLKSLMPSGATDEQFIELSRSVWSNRTDHYSDERFDAMKSPRGYQGKVLHKIDMITLGG